MKLRTFLFTTTITGGVASLLCPILSLAQIPEQTQESHFDPAGGLKQGQTSDDRRPGASLSSDERRAKLRQFIQNRSGGTGGRRSSGRTAATSVNAERVILKKDLAYGKDPLQKIDVFMPKKIPDKAMPILIFFHGGGWSRGDKASGDRDGKGNNYATQNIVFVNANYRLAPAVVHPKQIEDVAASVAYVKEHASEFGGDPHRIYIMGHSAGAHLVDLLGTNERFLVEKGLSFKDIKGVISLDTASLNLSERLKDNSREIGLIGPMINAAFGTDPKVLEDASPTLQIHKGKAYPPFLMYCGERRKSCVAQHEKFSKAMKEAGGTVTITPVPLNHAEINRAAGQTNSNIFKGVLNMI